MPPNRSEAKGSAIDINNLILTVLAIVRVDFAEQRDNDFD